MGRHVVVGSGAVGTAVAGILLDAGHEVRVVTRRGTGPDRAERVAADAADRARLVELAAGADAVYNCANPQYHRWVTDWPPIAAALLAAAESSGAVLVTTGNLYGYGPVDAPMTEQTPLAARGTKGRVRARMWEDALGAHRAGRVRATEVRGSDYVGVGANSLLNLLVVPRLARRKTAFVPADLDVPHTWTEVTDMARMLVTAATDERAWGRAWHVPSAPAVSVRELSALAAGDLGVPNRVKTLPYAALWAAGLVNPAARELRETHHQFVRPFVMDSSAATATFGLTATPLEDSVRRVTAAATAGAARAA